MVTIGSKIVGRYFRNERKYEIMKFLLQFTICKKIIFEVLTSAVSLTFNLASQFLYSPQRLFILNIRMKWHQQNVTRYCCIAMKAKAVMISCSAKIIKSMTLVVCLRNHPIKPPGNVIDTVEKSSLSSFLFLLGQIDFARLCY